MDTKIKSVQIYYKSTKLFIFVLNRWCVSKFFVKVNIYVFFLILIEYGGVHLLNAAKQKKAKAKKDWKISTLQNIFFLTGLSRLYRALLYKTENWHLHFF